LKRPLLIATSNAGKLREVQQILGSAEFGLVTLSDFPKIQPIDETGSTFEENAWLKARGYARHSNVLTLADDSGLEIGALNGAPGVRSARFMSDTASYEERNRTILEKLEKKSDRSAQFVCVIAIADPEGRRLHTSTGICAGRIARRSRGMSGFGYDPIFIPEGYDGTFGELPSEVKNVISHRARALQAAAAFLQSLTVTSAAR
jgi:non-canonical purine NTP pyrophosphatase (RdgB/HAM1 family)